MERDDADGVPSLFDAPPAAEPAGDRTKGAAETTPSPQHPTRWPSQRHFPPHPSKGASYLCSCPTPATRKSPELENLRLLIKPT